MAVSNWLQAAAENAAYYRQLKKIWDSSKDLAASTAIDENKAWERFRQRVSPAAKNRQSFIQRFSGFKAAAVFIIIAGAAISTWLLFKNEAVKEITAKTTLDILTDTLPDGSVVTLNRSSSIAYPSRFTAAARKVTLRGEAFFKVMPNPKKPFVISVNNITVTVVGTSFNIQAREESTEVIVETGIVRVSRGSKTTTLSAGEKLLLPAAGGPEEKTAVTDHLYNYYRTKTFVCDDTPLWKLVEVLNKAYNAHISIGSSAAKDLRLTTTFNNEPLEKILNIIHLTFDITVTRNGDHIILQ